MSAPTTEWVREQIALARRTDPNPGTLERVALPLAEERDAALALAEGAEKYRDRLRDCGQDAVCATPPGCLRHWKERNRELVEHLRAIEAAAHRACAAVGYDASLAQRIDALRAALARQP